VGQLSRPSWPNIPGLGDFSGPLFHSAQWDHSVDLKGKKVGVIGTGASAIQFIPEVAEQASQLTVFQRSAPYVLPRLDGAYGWLNRQLFKHIPGYERPFRYLLWKSGEMSTDAFDAGDNRVSKLYQWVTRRFREAQVTDPTLRKKLTPDYPIGCKRILFTSNYYPALCQPQVELNTEGVDCVTSTGVRDNTGRDIDCDVLIMGTGFKATEFLSPMQISGRDGVDLHQQWQAGAEAYLGMTVPGFPNLFLMYGPNTNLGGNSIIFMIECQARYIVQALKALRKQATLEVKPEVHQQFNAQTQERLKHTVWNAGCSSWYHTDDGRITNNWPGRTAEYRAMTAQFQPQDYVSTSA
jgi:cation diffusion facilitator CzcD-associated flavoprotein CzcO